MTNPPPLYVCKPEDAVSFKAFGDEMILHLSADATGGSCSMWTNITPPGGGPPPHYHTQEDEWFWPMSDEAEFFINGDWTRVPARTGVFAPRNSIHTFRNPNDEPLEMLIQTIPGGFDKFFAECAEEFKKDGPPNMETLVKISEKYGIFYLEPR